MLSAGSGIYFHSFQANPIINMCKHESLPFIHSFIHSSIHSFIHPSIHSSLPNATKLPIFTQYATLLLLLPQSICYIFCKHKNILKDSIVTWKPQFAKHCYLLGKIALKVHSLKISKIIQCYLKSPEELYLMMWSQI